jgi:hypothetical protein
MRRPIVAVVLSGLLLLGAAPTRAQESPPVEYPLTCDYMTTRPDPIRVQVCIYPSDTVVVMLAEPSISGHPLLTMTIHSGLTLWAPIAQRYMPRGWATAPGDVFRVIHPSTPPCDAMTDVDQTTMYYYDLGGGRGVYSALDGTAYCIH